jgi:hypothetical protein
MTKKNDFHVSIDMSGSRGRKLDVLATARKVSRCQVLAMLIDEAWEHAVPHRANSRGEEKAKICC